MTLDDISDTTFAQRCMAKMPQLKVASRTTYSKDAQEFVQARTQEEMLDEIHFMLRYVIASTPGPRYDWMPKEKP